MTFDDKCVIIKDITAQIVSTFDVEFFLPQCMAWGFSLWGEIMSLSIIHNTDTSAGLAYKIARVVYAESGAQSLNGVEALTSMIKNMSDKTGVCIAHLISDEAVFNSLSKKSARHSRLYVSPNDNAFQMCLRVAKRMLSGGLPDCCYGATAFHHSEIIPQWARARGYIADIDEMLFYL